MARMLRMTSLAAALLLVVGGCAGPAAPDTSATGTTDPATAGDATEPSGAETTAAEDDHDAGGMAEDDHDAGGMAEDDHDGDVEAADVDRVVEVEMGEFSFTPSELTVNVGETVRFDFVNAGAIEHEAVLGPEHVQDEHEEAMKDGAMTHGHDTPAITVAAGETGSITYTFEEAGELLLGCHIPGHWGAGMRATVTVVG